MKERSKKLIIISKLALENIFLKSKSSKSSFVNALKITSSIFLPLLIGCFTTKDFQSDVVKILFITATIVLGITIVVLLLIIHYKFNGGFFEGDIDLERLKEEIVNNSEYEEDYTFILLFPRKGKDGVLEFPVVKREQRNNSYFFPFLQNEYRDEDIKPHIKNIKQLISGAFKINIPIRVNYIYELDISTTFLSTNSNLPKDYHFRYLHVYSLSPFFRSYIHKKLQDEGYVYRTLDEILKDEQTLLYNRHAIKTVKDNIAHVNESIDKYEMEKSKIIWNIDKTCNNNCSICAYGASSPEMICMSTEERKKAINAFKSLDVGSIDFAMGAHPNIQEMKSILQYAKNALHNTSINITATEEVLSLLGNDFIKKNIDCVDITYDFPHLNAKGKSEEHRSLNYNKKNYEIARHLISEKILVKAHVVIHEGINVKDLKEIRNKLWDIRIKHILFIRLMPLGNQNINNYPEKLLQKNTYKELVNISNKDMKLHCALKGLLGEKHPCELGYNKIGISQTGDIYTCPWAEHILTPDNPFLVGNIIEDNDSLQSILLNSKPFLDTLNNNNLNQPHCKIFSYLSNDDMFSTGDNLYN